MAKIIQMREGFWYSKDEPNLPRPQSNKFWGPKQEEFIAKLKKVQAKLHMTRYIGFSTCRLCRKPTSTGSGEYQKGNWTWPEGFLHYVERHNVKPTDAFLEFIMGKNWMGIVHSTEISDAIKKVAEEKRGTGRPPKIKPDPYLEGIANRKTPKIYTQNMPQPKKPHIDDVFKIFQDYIIAGQLASINFRKDPTGKALIKAQKEAKARLTKIGLAQHIDWTEK